ncbi:hypothetical protein O988_09417 [Pseudogymnoascus sp. VKM F-3808]|nr:hypothetical protein O988_09417 [Pseudogymnoascus sp. VKM F-3808]
MGGKVMTADDDGEGTESRCQVLTLLCLPVNQFGAGRGPDRADRGGRDGSVVPSAIAHQSSILPSYLPSERVRTPLPRICRASGAGMCVSRRASIQGRGMSERDTGDMGDGWVGAGEGEWSDELFV